MKLLITTLLLITVNSSLAVAGGFEKTLERLNYSLQTDDISEYRRRYSYFEASFFGSNIQMDQKTCNQILALPIEQLFQFKHLIEDHPNQGLAFCSEKISNKLQSYFQIQDSNFDQYLKFKNNFGIQKENASIKRIGLPYSDEKLQLEKPVPYRKSPVYFNADLPKGVVALTFDDGPKRKTTKDILDTLRDKGVKVTFFGVGRNVKKYPELVQRAHDEGHSFGSHSYDHANLPKLSFKKAYDNIARGRSAVSDVLNLDYPFFRFPYGNRSKKLQKWVKSKQMATFFWNIDTLDWKITNPQKLFEYSVKKINEHQRGIILFHDIQPQTSIILPQLIDELISSGYRFVVFVK